MFEMIHLTITPREISQKKSRDGNTGQWLSTVAPQCRVFLNWSPAPKRWQSSGERAISSRENKMRKIRIQRNRIENARMNRGDALGIFNSRLANYLYVRSEVNAPNVHFFCGIV